MDRAIMEKNWAIKIRILNYYSKFKLSSNCYITAHEMKTNKCIIDRKIK